jgi:hypothetical protein
MMRDSRRGSPEWDVAWQIIVEEGEKLAAQETQWYLTFKDPSNGTAEARLNQLHQIQAYQAQWHPENDLRDGTPPPTQFQSTASPSTQASKDSPDSCVVLSPETAETVDSDGGAELSEQDTLEGVDARPSRLIKRPRVKDGEVELPVAKKTRTEDEMYGDDRDAIEKWCREHKLSRLHVWEKVEKWKWATGQATRPVLRPAPPQPAPPPLALIQTPNMDSPAEIIAIQRQWGNLKPDQRGHPLDKKAVPDWPVEDELEKCRLKKVNKYKCAHEVAGHLTDGPCCRNGLDKGRKLEAIGRAKRKQKTKTEKLILLGQLHVFHKTWTGWSSEATATENAAAEIARVDTILRPVQGVQQAAPAPVPAPAPQLVPQFVAAQQPQLAQQKLPTFVPAPVLRLASQQGFVHPGPAPAPRVSARQPQQQQ